MKVLPMRSLRQKATMSFLLIVLGLLGGLSIGKAQTKSTYVDRLLPEVQEAYDKCLKIGYNDAHFLQTVNEMEAKARLLSNLRGELTAHSLRIDFYARNAMEKEMKIEVERAKNFAIKNHTETFYFFYWARLIRYLLYNAHHFVAAMEEINNMELAANTKGGDYGVIQAHSLRAQLYSNLGYRLKAIAEFHKAIEWGETHTVPAGNLSFDYIQISSLLLDQEHYDEALAYADKGLNASKAILSRGEAFALKGLCYFFLKQYDKAEEEEKAMEQLFKNNIFSPNDVADYIFLKSIIIAHKGQAKEAYDLTRGENSDTQRDLISSCIAETSGDNAQAYLFLKAARNKSDRAQSGMLSQFLHEINERSGFTKMLEEQRRLALANASMAVLNSQAAVDALNRADELQHSKNMENQLKLHNLQLSSKNRELEIARNRMLIQSRNAKLDADTKRVELHKRFSLYLTICVILIAIAFAVPAYLALRERQVEHRLKQQRKALDKARKKMIQERDRVLHSDALKAEFLQTISHEVRTPLNAIVGFSDLITDPSLSNICSNKDTHTYSETIKHNAELLETLVSNIAELSDLELKKIEIHQSLISAKDVCEETMANADKSSQKQGVDFRLGIAANAKDTFLSCDVTLLQRILRTLLINAIKFTNEGSVELTYQDRGNSVRFTVTDTGIGIDPAYATRIFERFEKLNSFSQGLGLGLYKCRLIAEQIDAQIWLDTSYRQGSRFHLEVPKSIHTVPVNSTNSNSHKRLSQVIASAVIAALLFVPLANSRQGDDVSVPGYSLYSYYQKCKEVATSPQFLLMSDTLFRWAKKEGDTHVQAWALSNRIYNMLSLDPKGNYDKEVKQAEDYCFSIHENTQAFFIWGQVIYRYIYSERYDQALLNIHDFRLKARQCNDTYGLIFCEHLMGEIFFGIGDFEQAAKYFRRATQIRQESKFSHYYITSYNSLFWCYYLMEDIDTARSVVLESLLKVNDYERQEPLFNLALIAFHEGDYKTFTTYDEQASQSIAHNGLTTLSPDFFYCLKALSQSNINQTDRALQITDSITDPLISSHIKQLIYIHDGRFDQALANYKRYRQIYDDVYQGTNLEAILKIVSGLQLADVKLQSDSITLRYNMLRLRHIEKQRAELLQRNTISRLQASGRQLALSNMGIKLENQHFIAQKDRTRLFTLRLGANSTQEGLDRQRHLNAIMIITSVMLLLLSLTSFYYWRTERKLTRKYKRQILLLTQTADTTRKERDRARQNGLLKDKFIQNMGVHILTPLHSILSFTSILTSPDLRLDQTNQQNRYLAHAIASQAEELINLITSVLEQDPKTETD